NESAILSGQASHKIREEILAAEPGRRGAMVSDYLIKAIARILKLSPSAVNVDKPISSMGLDSLMSIELKSQIELDLGASVAMARFIQGPTILEITDWVMEPLSRAQKPDSAVALALNEFEEGTL